MNMIVLFTHISFSILNWAAYEHNDLHLLVAILTMLKSQLYQEILYIMHVYTKGSKSGRSGPKNSHERS